MSKLMKKARDIRLIGIGLVAGMVLGYFIAVEQPPPLTPGGVTMPLALIAPRPTSVTPATEVPIEWFESPLAVRTVTRKRAVVFPEAPTTEKWRQPLIDR